MIFALSVAMIVASATNGATAYDVLRETASREQHDSPLRLVFHFSAQKSPDFLPDDSVATRETRRKDVTLYYATSGDSKFVIKISDEGHISRTIYFDGESVDTGDGRTWDAGFLARVDVPDYLDEDFADLLWPYWNIQTHLTPISSDPFAKSPESLPRAFRVLLKDDALPDHVTVSISSGGTAASPRQNTEYQIHETEYYLISRTDIYSTNILLSTTIFDGRIALPDGKSVCERMRTTFPPAENGFEPSIELRITATQFPDQIENEISQLLNTPIDRSALIEIPEETLWSEILWVADDAFGYGYDEDYLPIYFITGSFLALFLAFLFLAAKGMWRGLSRPRRP